MLHRRSIELGGDSTQHRLTLGTILREHAHLDERVRLERDVDLAHHLCRQPVLADADDGMESVRLRAQLASLLRRQFDHARSVAEDSPYNPPMSAARSKGRRIVEWLLVVAALIVGIPAVAWLSQERLIFFPQPLTNTTHLPAHATPLEVVAADGTRLAGFQLAGSPKPAPAVLYFGGNAEEISWTLADVRWPRTWTIAGLNYRGYGRSEGKPGEQALLADGLALFDAIAARDDVDPRRIVVVGRSLGTGVAARVAAERPVAGAVLISPYDSLVEVGRSHYPWLPVSWLLRHRFDSLTAVKEARVPLLTIVGTADGIVPLSRSRVLHEAWPGPKQWLALEGAGHNNLSMSVEFWDGLKRYLASLPPRS